MPKPKPKTLDELLEEAKHRTMSDAERIQQRISFAYGNTKLHNDKITRELVEKVSREED